LKHHPGVLAVGSDFTFEMMLRGKPKAGAEQIRWNTADALHLPFPDESFDAVTAALGCATSSIGSRPFAKTAPRVETWWTRHLP